MSVAGNMNPIAAVTKQLRANGDTKTSMRVLSETEAEPLVKVQEPSIDDRTLFQQAGVTTSDVARKFAAEAEGQKFLAEYGMKGLMLPNGGANASPHQMQRREHARMLALGATDTELDTVARITATRYISFVDREARMRVDQWIANDPSQFHQRLFNPKLDAAAEKEKIVAEFKTKDFDEQKRLSRVKDKDVGLPVDDLNQMNALRRGYLMIAEVMRDRGLTPSMSLKGERAAQARANNELRVQKSSQGSLASRYGNGMGD
jgi:hypothetical protein